ncbi:DUF1552 domain-containing protein [Planctomicrobium piriforme]|uniref:Tat (Twin-arginine translocation) pathway signal sequence n=1 Tax=Planctomicrobium piriforme TaxID=1576369 RepID=A0A1I3BMH8_9PLAN|nr:DUF1552 domain-containing protein [Planctomicrobium piriforme]SFH63477.1 Protein of unknown function [Planctomicrobium piriforme]
MNPISRRAILKGLGATMALPVLDAMVPKAAWAAPEMLAGNRMAFVYIPNGAIMEDWTPATVGKDFKLSKTMSPLNEVRSDLLVLSGMAHDLARAKNDGAGDHARDSAVFLTGSRPRKSDSDIHVGQSVDQMAAEKIGQQTRLPSLELGTEAGRQAGKCDSGYGCAYQSNISWKTATTPMAKEINPKAVFERMFGGDLDPRTQAKRAFYRKSILDFVAEDTTKLTKQLGSSDKQKMDEYFTSVREIEERIARAGEQQPTEAPKMTLPDGVPSDFVTHVRLMYDLMLLAFQTDTTRICTLMLANSGSNRTYKEIGVPEAHHQISHHKSEPEKLKWLQMIDQHMMQQFAYFLKRMKETKEGSGNLLAHSMIMYGCSIADPNRHAHDNLPILMAGGGKGTIDTGRHVKFDKEVPLSNLFVSMLERMNVNVDSFGDSTGKLKQLKA